MCHTTSWGMSTRMIGGVIMAHGDDKGLVLPPRLAPYQVVIVPIGRGDDRREPCSTPPRELAERAGAGRRARRTSTTATAASPGFKFNDWEMRGVPLRLELGPRDLDRRRRRCWPAASATRARSRSPLDRGADAAARHARRLPGRSCYGGPTEFRDEHTADGRHLGRLRRRR